MGLSQKFLTWVKAGNFFAAWVWLGQLWKNFPPKYQSFQFFSVGSKKTLLGHT